MSDTRATHITIVQDLFGTDSRKRKTVVPNLEERSEGKELDARVATLTQWEERLANWRKTRTPTPTIRDLLEPL